MKFKSCTKCKQEKPVNEFGVHKSRKDGLRSVCKVCNTEQAILYAKKNVKKVVEYQTEYRKKNRIKINEQIKQTKEQNKDYYERIRKLWKQNNKEKLVVYNQNRKVRKRNLSGKISPSISRKLSRLQNDRCANCTKKLNGQYHLDHIFPLSLGGAHDDNNLQLLCPKCNLTKYTKDPIVWANQNGRLL